jgi:hypothetical protein
MRQGAIPTILAVLALAGLSFAVNVTVTTPTANSTVSSPATIQASASSSHSITGWRIYVDGSSVYTGGAVQRISPAIGIAAGTHQVIVRAWDSSGAYGSANLTLTVSASAPPVVQTPAPSATGVTVAVSSPTSTTIRSPITLAASASSAAAITGWHIYVDNVSVYTGGATASISAPLTMTAGTHHVIVRAWNSTGAYGSADLTLTDSPTHHIFVIAEENEDYSDIIGNSNAPYINSTLVPMGTVWSNVYSNLHGSMYDYILATSGIVPSQCNGDDCGSTPIAQDNLMQALQKAGMTWEGYQEELPACGYFAPQSTDWTYEGYYQRHNPFPWYAIGIAHPDTWCPYTNFASDLANRTVADFNWITPDVLDEMHGDGNETQAQLVQAGDAWLAANVPQILNSSYFQPGGDGILMIWWDEGQEDTYYDGTCSPAGGTTCGGRLPMLVIGPNIKENNADSTYNEQQGVLRFFIEQLGLNDFMGMSATAADFQNTTTTPIPVSPINTSAPAPCITGYTASGSTVSVAATSPCANTSVASPAQFNATATSIADVPIVGWAVYANDVQVYSADTTSLNATVALPAGTDAIIVRAWDQNGNYGSSDFTVTGH